MKTFNVFPIWETVATIRWDVRYDSMCVWSGLKDLTNGEFNGTSLEAFCSWDDIDNPKFSGSWCGSKFEINIVRKNNVYRFEVRTITGSELKEVRIRRRK